MEYNIQNLEYAVSVFYNSEQDERAQAHQWLTAAQRSPEAWSFVWELMQFHKSTEVQFFAATTLHTKLLRCWNELPPDSYAELKDKIMKTVLAYANGPKIVLNRLCISLAAFILQQGSSDFVAILNHLSSIDNTSLLLEVLTVIPEEFNSMTMGSVLRTKNRIALQGACPTVLVNMLKLLQTNINSKTPPTEETMQIWCSASNCASSWLSLDDPNSVRDIGTSSSLVELMPLCEALHAVVKVIYIHNEVISDSALESCESALNAMRAAGCSYDAARFPTAALQLMTALAELAQPILARDNVPNSINEEVLSALATCAVSLGDTHTRALVVAAESGDSGARLFLELLLASQAAPGHYPIHETRSQTVLGWWYTLQDDILYLKDNSTVVNPYWIDLFSRLFNILIQKSEAPTSDGLSRDDAELIRCYRQDIADTVMYCYSIVGEWSWSLVESAWRNASCEAKREAALHVFKTLAETSPHHNHTHINRMFTHAVEAVANDNSDQRLLNTALECIGEYAVWLSVLNEVPLCESAMRACGVALIRSPRSASLALRKLCSECAQVAAPIKEQIVLALKTHKEHSNEPFVRRQLLGAAGSALAAAYKDPNTAELLQSLAEDILSDMMIESRSSGKNASGASSLATLLSSLSKTVPLASQLFRITLPALHSYAVQPLLVPSLFLILKNAVTVLMDDCLPMIEEISQLTIRGNETLPCPSGLDVVKLILLSFGTQWEGCSNLFQVTITSAARTCACDASSHSDLTEALFDTLLVITKKRPAYIQSLNDILPQLVELGCQCTELWESRASASACRWLGLLGESQPTALAEHGFRLIRSTLRGIGGVAPRTHLQPLAELLLALNKARWPTHGLAFWLAKAFEQQDFPTKHAHAQHKKMFMANVLKEKNSKRKILETVQEFSLICRGLIDTEYARQSLAATEMCA